MALASDMKANDLTTPVWVDRDISLAQYAVPHAGLSADVIVVGGGIAGVTTAYLLAREGESVMLLDEGQIGSGQTSRTSAHLSSIIDDRFSAVESHHNAETARLAYESHARAIDKIEQIVREEKIACDFARVDGFLFTGIDGSDKIVNDEFEVCKRIGVPVQRIDDVPSTRREGQALRFPNQAVFHPLKYLHALATVAGQKGVRFYSGKRVKSVEGADLKQSTPAKVTLIDDAVLTAKQVVVATNVPSPVAWNGVYLKMAAYRTYMVGLAIEKGSVTDGLYWDTHDPYHYVRVHHEAGHDVLLVGGEDHKTGQKGASPERFDKLVEWARYMFPQAREEVCRWSGQVQETGDGLGFIGRAPGVEGAFVITGDSGMGLTHGTLGAMLITDLIKGRKNAWESVYEPSRKLLNKDVISEAANTNAQYTDWITSGEIKSEDDLKPGEGGLMRSGLTKLAIYRDDAGQVHRMSAVCPHLKCIVHWNGVEKTWDCPCHGSHFDCHGKNIIGPAFSDLEKA